MKDTSHIRKPAEAPDEKIEFKIGDKVTWQARFPTVKTGTVIAVIPAGEMPWQVLSCVFYELYRQISFDPEATRPHESYIIQSPMGKFGGKPSAYRPLVQNLKKV
jgi:hypothetical protein